MIWISDAKNALIFQSSDWTEITGQSVSEATGLGWLGMVHPDDREIVRAVFIQACARQLPYYQKYRLSKKEGGYVCVIAIASPSHLPETGAFLGYHGSMSLLDVDPEGFQASGEAGTTSTPAALLNNEPLSVVEAIADHLLIVRAEAAAADRQVLVSIIDVALLAVGRRLAQVSLAIERQN